MLHLPLSLFLTAGIVLFAQGAAHGVTILFADLTNAQENPPAIPTTTSGGFRTPSFGTASFVLNDARTALTFTSTVFNIDFTGMQTPDRNDNLTVAHIHAGPNVTPSTNGPVAWGFIGTPFNDTNPRDVVVTPFSTGVGGTVSGKWDAPEGNNTTLTAQVSNILGGRSYINFHTVQFPGGEVRGNISIAPEPGTLLLVTSGMMGLLSLTRLTCRRPHRNA
jgi:CHRD domain